MDTSNINEAEQCQYSYDLNYYYNTDYFPNQDLVFDTIEYFEIGGGKGLGDPLEFLNLLVWHYDHIKANLSTPYNVITQIDKIAKTLLTALRVINWRF